MEISSGLIPAENGSRVLDYEWDDISLSAKDKAFGAEYGQNIFHEYMPPPVDLKFFDGTSYQVTIPVAPESIPQARQEIDELTIQELEEEPFQNFFRHIDMLARLATADKIAPLIPTILKRSRDETSDFFHQIEFTEEDLVRYRADTYYRALACIETCEDEPTVSIPKEVVEEVYENSFSFQPKLFKSALIFDRRNRKSGESINVSEKFRKYLEANESKDLEENEKAKIDSLIFWAPVDPELYPAVISYTLRQSSSQEEMLAMLHGLIDVGGLEIIRKSLREIVKKDPTFSETFETVFDYLGMDPTRPRKDLREDVYEKIDFSEYAPNREVQEFEIDMLKDELDGSSQVLDVACGTGRHLLELSDSDTMHIAGIDMVPKHIDHIKKRAPDADVRVSSWFDLPYEDRQFDNAYCLGRSVTHNTTVPDMVAFLKEMGRVVKDDGKIIIDTPDSQSGDIFEEMKRTDEICRRKGIIRYLEETIIDSPDKSNYFDRYVPIPLRFRLIAYLAGFHTEEVSRRTYHSVTGNENVNIYWRFTKRKSPATISSGEKASIYRFIRGHGDNKTVISFGADHKEAAALFDANTMKQWMLQLSPPEEAT